MLIHEAAKLLADWMAGKQLEVVKELVNPILPVTHTVLLVARLSSAMPLSDVETLMKLLEFEHKAFITLSENAMGIRQ